MLSFNQVAYFTFGISILWVVGLLVIEFYQVSKGGPLITTVMRDLIKRLPWPFVLLALTSGFMMGHCYGN